MRAVACMAGCLFLLAGICGMAEAEPFAPLVEIPADVGKESDVSFLEVATAERSVIPSAAEVGLPAYPGARILYTQMDNRIEKNGQWVDLPNRIFMAAEDEPQQVMEFYRQRLDGWQTGENGGATMFYRKQDGFDPEEDVTEPRIIISAESEPRGLMPSSKTTIDIYYDTD